MAFPGPLFSTSLSLNLLLLFKSSSANLSPFNCRDAVEAEFQKNKELGEATGCWKSGMLVEDDNGSVRKALEGLATAQ